MTIITVGIDLAKNVFAVHGVNDTGKPALVKPKIPHEKLLDLIGMEACSRPAGLGQSLYPRHARPCQQTG